MNQAIKTKIGLEQSKGYSGVIINDQRIPQLKEDCYHIQPLDLDGNAPKNFVRAYFFTQDGIVRKSHPRTWDHYIVKSAEKWYPHESVIEFLLNRIGQTLGLRMNEVKLLRINKQIRFLSKYFLNPNEILIHGAEICGAHLADLTFAEKIAKDRNSARELFTFEFVSEAISGEFGEDSVHILHDLVKMLTFDAIVGNNDRHFYNWGVVRTIYRPDPTPKLAPIYDSARGLFWNFPDSEIVEIWNRRETIGKKYIKKALPRISFEADKSCNHFCLVKYLSKLNNSNHSTIKELTNEKCEQSVMKMYDSEFSRFFIPERNSLVKWVLHKRFDQIRNSL